MNISALLDLVQLIIDGNVDEVSGRLLAAPVLATMALPIGNKAHLSKDLFFKEISHYMYGGDTALHMAAAAFSRPVAELLVAHEADWRARNRRGAVPLHYAADGNWSSPLAQAEVIKYLISIGSDSNSVDKSGVAPLHRAVRTRSLSAVSALLVGGANLQQPNKAGSTPLHLAVQLTGATGSGSDNARHHQARIISLLLEHGARPTDKNAQGKTVYQAATVDWIRALLSDGSAPKN